MILPTRSGVVAAATVAVAICASFQAGVGPASGTSMTPTPRVPNEAKATPTKTPIKHFISLMQENHSFDNYFGTYPGADGIPADVCMPIVPDTNDGCVKPFRIGNRSIVDLGHSEKVFNRQWNEGKLNGFITAFSSETGGRPTDEAMGHYDEQDLSYYWNIADNYVLFDHFFTSSKGGSVSNHMYWVTAKPGSPPGLEVIPKEGFDEPTIFDRLQAKGISWKFYVQNYDPNVNLRSKAVGDRGAQVVWVPLLNYPRYLDNPDLFSHIAPLEQYYKDLADDTLPAVSYIVPSGASEHPPGSIHAGEAFVRTLINSLMRSNAWSSSAFMWSYDDWGGWYDHVAPPVIDDRGFGFRAPALLVSSRARKGYIAHTQLDFTSILRFVEDNWQVDPLAARDGSSNTFDDVFDFGVPPRTPRFLPDARHVPAAPTPKRGIIYGAYTSAIALAATLVALAGVTTRRRRYRRSMPIRAADGTHEN